MCIIVSWEHYNFSFCNMFIKDVRFAPILFMPIIVAGAESCVITFSSIHRKHREYKVRRGSKLPSPPSVTHSSSKAPLAKDGITCPNIIHQPGTESSNAYGDSSHSNHCTVWQPNLRYDIGTGQLILNIHCIIFKEPLEFQINFSGWKFPNIQICLSLPPLSIFISERDMSQSLFCCYGMILWPSQLIEEFVCGLQFQMVNVFNHQWREYGSRQAGTTLEQ